MSGDAQSIWRAAPLSEIASIQLGKKLDRGKDQPGKPMPYLRNVNVRWFSTDTDDLLSMPFTERESDVYAIQDGDVLICEGGEPGRAAIWKGGPTDLKFQMALHRVRTGPSLQPEWLQLFLWHAANNGLLEPLFNGMTIRHLSGRALSALSVPLPPLAEQRRIVARIEALFDRTRQARADLLRVAPLADRYLEQTLAAAFRGDLTVGFRATGAQPAADAVLRDLRSQRRTTTLPLSRRAALQAVPTVPESLPELPNGWCWTCVEELASDQPRSIQSGPFGSSLLHSEFTPEGQLVIGIDNVRDGAFSMGSQNRIPSGKFVELERFQARPLDVLITVMATVGRCCVVPADIEDAIITKHVYRISVEPRVIDPYFLMNALRGSEVVLEQMGANIRGQTRPGINGEILKALLIPLPPLEEQREIVRLIDAAQAASARTQAASARALVLLDHLERGILTRAFRGELVPHEATDEPASVVVANVRAAPAEARRRGRPRRVA